MSIRSYLILSYLALIVLLMSGMWAVDELWVAGLQAQNLSVTEEAVQGLTRANYRLSEEMLTAYGEKMVEAKAEDAAKELAYRFRGRKSFDYAKIRRDKALRAVATEKIYTLEGQAAGYLLLFDKNAESVIHHDPKVEGQNYRQWREKYPEMWKIVQRSLKERKVTGYFTFFDPEGRERRRFTTTIQVPGTPFHVAAVVNIDEFFLPTHAKIRQGCKETMLNARQAITENTAKVEGQVKLAGLVGGVVFSIIGGFSGLWFAGAFSRPILRLRDAVRQVGEGNFAVAVPAKGAKEVVELAQSFNQLGQQLTDYMEKRDFIRDTFGRYVTQEVARKLLDSQDGLALGGEAREVSLLMSDLRGFTALTADMPPDRVITFLNRYLGKMIEILLEYRAVIDEIVGDGLLAFFGAPEPQEDHPARAVACALEMQAAMEEINAANAAEGFPHLEMGVAVNTGTVVVGNIGSEKRTKYGAVGSPVNFTGRIESYAVGGQVLVGPATFRRMGDTLQVRERIAVEMKGIPHPITLYDVRGISGPYHLQLKERCETLMPLPEEIPVRLSRLRQKVITGAAMAARMTHLCETSALVVFEGDLGEWEDVRLYLLDDHREEMPGKIYGKVTRVRPLDDGRREAAIRFTSISPGLYQTIRRAVNRD